jgi:cytoskeletal protein CcmA (bactofilin family)
MALFSGKRKPINFGVISSVIGHDAQVRGEIVTKGSARIDGGFEGKITAKGDVFVGEGSRVVGNISGAKIVVSGEVNGNIIAADGLEITKSGKVYGDITGDKLLVDEGAIYKGKVTMETSFKKGTGPAQEFETEGLLKAAKSL